MKSDPWRHIPWLLGLLCAPLLRGSVTAEGQAVVGLLFALSLLFLARVNHGSLAPVIPAGWRWVAIGLLALPLVPLPAGLVHALSHQRLALAEAFPVTAGHVPGWLMLSVSPGGTVQRLWELALIITAFFLARYAAGEPGLPRLLAWTIGLTVLLLAASDVWLRSGDQQTILGLWENRWHYAAGTFMNRNHFAGWIFVALPFVAGWLMRNFRPLHSARAVLLERRERRRFDAIALLPALLFGVVMAAMTGSRGGALAGVVGVGVWTYLLAIRSRSRTRAVVVGGLILAAVILVVGASDLVLTRALGEHHGYLGFKSAIWLRSLHILGDFPVFGTGWGSFVSVFNYFKTTDGDKTYLHAENDLVQLLMETGLVGFCVYAFVIFSLGRVVLRHVVHEKMAEPELCIGAVAGLAAFICHSQFEFVFQVTANAVLAAVLLGFVIGQRERQQVHVPILPAPPTRARQRWNWLWALALLAVAAVQGTSVCLWLRARGEYNQAAQLADMQTAVDCWPWQRGRELVLVQSMGKVPPPRTLAARKAAGAEMDRRLDRALAWDPLDWQLRLERASRDLYFQGSTPRTRAAIWEAVRVSPLQPAIPLLFAEYYADRDPALCLELLHAIGDRDTNTLRPVLRLAWEADHQPTTLWSFTPDTVPGLLLLGDFAAEQKIPVLALQAWLQLSNRVEPVVLARRFLGIQQPAPALARLPDPPVTDEEKLLRGRAYYDLGRYAEALQCAQSVWEKRADARRVTEVFVADLSATRPISPPRNGDEAQVLAQKWYDDAQHRPPVPALRDLAERFPAQWHIQWLLYQTELNHADPAAAARDALELAARVTGSITGN